MTSRILYFVIYLPKYIETARRGNFYLGSISALLQQLRHYICYLKTGDQEHFWSSHPLVTCPYALCRTKVWSAGAHTFSSTLLRDLKKALFCWFGLLSLLLPCHDEYMTRASDGKNEKVHTFNIHSSTFPSSLSLPCGKSSST